MNAGGVSIPVTDFLPVLPINMIHRLASHLYITRIHLHFFPSFLFNPSSATHNHSPGINPLSPLYLQGSFPVVIAMTSSRNGGCRYDMQEVSFLFIGEEHVKRIEAGYSIIGFVHEFRTPPKYLLGQHPYCTVHFDAFHVVLNYTTVYISLLKGGVHTMKKPRFKDPQANYKLEMINSIRPKRSGSYSDSDQVKLRDQLRP
ncbi:unnamed protein product [Lactuca virosa]|uniref:Peptidylprolyl isomerase n=1 Tax=Lactuca virosa TaxID=75947 RepID=A0AAU9P3C1_9ASTR|nr:unnamed protein product [Lactuca virosa]